MAAECSTAAPVGLAERVWETGRVAGNLAFDRVRCEWGCRRPAAAAVLPETWRDMQLFANECGVPLPVTGEATPHTVRFVRMFQDTYSVGDYWANGLKPDGIPGPLTRAAVDHARKASAYQNRILVSENFYYDEYQTQQRPLEVTATNQAVFIVRELVHTVQLARTSAGRPMRIVSGYRNLTWNELVGGSKYSQHVLGKAADIESAQMRFTEPQIRDILTSVKQADVGGVGILGRWVLHFDVRGWWARWFY